MSSKVSMALMTAAAAILAITGPAKAAQVASTLPVKFVCGVQAPERNPRLPAEPAVKPGTYATTINIENLGAATTITTTVSVATSASSKLSGVTATGPSVLLGR